MNTKEIVKLKNLSLECLIALQNDYFKTEKHNFEKLFSNIISIINQQLFTDEHIKILEVLEEEICQEIEKIYDKFKKNQTNINIYDIKSFNNFYTNKQIRHNISTFQKYVGKYPYILLPFAIGFIIWVVYFIFNIGYIPSINKEDFFMQILSLSVFGSFYLVIFFGLYFLQTYSYFMFYSFKNHKENLIFKNQMLINFSVSIFVLLLLNIYITVFLFVFVFFVYYLCNKLHSNIREIFMSYIALTFVCFMTYLFCFGLYMALSYFDSQADSSTINAIIISSFFYLLINAVLVSISIENYRNKSTRTITFISFFAIFALCSILLLNKNFIRVASLGYQKYNYISMSSEALLHIPKSIKLCKNNSKISCYEIYKQNNKQSIRLNHIFVLSNRGKFYHLRATLDKNKSIVFNVFSKYIKGEQEKKVNLK